MKNILFTIIFMLMLGVTSYSQQIILNPVQNPVQQSNTFGTVTVNGQTSDINIRTTTVQPFMFNQQQVQQQPQQPLIIINSPESNMNQYHNQGNGYNRPTQSQPQQMMQFHNNVNDSREIYKRQLEDLQRRSNRPGGN